MSIESKTFIYCASTSDVWYLFVCIYGVHFGVVMRKCSFFHMHDCVGKWVICTSSICLLRMERNVGMEIYVLVKDI